MHYTTLLILASWLFTHCEAIPTAQRKRTSAKTLLTARSTLGTATPDISVVGPRPDVQAVTQDAAKEAAKESGIAKENTDQEDIIKIDQALQELGKITVPSTLPGPSALDKYAPPKELKKYSNGNICHTRSTLLKCWWYLNIETRIDEKHTQLQRKAFNIIFDAISSYILGHELSTFAGNDVLDRWHATAVVWAIFMNTSQSQSKKGYMRRSQSTYLRSKLQR